MKPLYIFDLDETLALVEHRLHFIAKDREGGPDWDAFFLACNKDEPNQPVIDTLHRLQRGGADIHIWSGRSTIALVSTCAWLSRYQIFIGANELLMRQQGDFTPDDELKKQWLDAMLLEDRQRLVGVFDDRDKVVNMWRENGITCFQVAPGNF